MRGNENEAFNHSNDAAVEIKLIEVLVGDDDFSDRGCDPNVTCKDVLTVVSDACIGEDGNEDNTMQETSSLRVHFDKTELSRMP